MTEEPARRNLIAELHSALEPLSFVRAAWLEGADAAGRADGYSDVDLWLDVDAGHEEQAFSVVRDTVSTFGPLDVDTARPHPDPLLLQRFYRASGLSLFWFVDVCVQTHGRRMSFGADDPFSVLFDRAEILRSHTQGQTAGEVWRAAQVLNRQRWRFLLVEKEVRRAHQLEALAYYHDEVLGPLVELLRLRYAPGKCGYGLKHIYADLPLDAANRLEELYACTRPDELTRGVERTELWFDQLLLQLRPQGASSP